MQSNDVNNEYESIPSSAFELHFILPFLLIVAQISDGVDFDPEAESVRCCFCFKHLFLFDLISG
jgi:hypothetical protein